MSCGRMTLTVIPRDLDLGPPVAAAGRIVRDLDAGFVENIDHMFLGMAVRQSQPDRLSGINSGVGL